MSTFNLYWVREDRQGDIFMGNYESKEAAAAAIEAAEQELLEQCADDDCCATIKAGHWEVDEEDL
jgi:hypothetical protein